MAGKTVAAVLLAAQVGFWSARVAAGQAIENGGLRLSLSSGFASGGGELWSVGRLPIFLPASGLTRPNSSWDTLTVNKSLGSGPTIAIAVAGTLSGPLSVGGSFVLNMLKVDNGCRVFFNSFPATTAAGNPNPVVCQTVDDDDSPFAVIDLVPFFELRLPVIGQSRPYIRAGAGLSSVANTTTQAVRAGDLVNEKGSGALRPVLEGFLGIEMLERDSGLRAEVGFLRHRFDTISSVNPDATVNVGRRWRNQFSLRVGLIFALDA